MNDTELMSLWSALEPSPRRRTRIETRLFEWLEANETSIADEWLHLLKVEPVSVPVYAAMGAIALVLLTPVGWITGWFLL